jgi:hypothetical protein
MGDESYSKLADALATLPSDFPGCPPGWSSIF